MILPVGNRVLIRREHPEEQAGSVFLPETARDYPQLGRVIAAGDRGEAMTFAGQLAWGIEPLVLYSKYLSPTASERSTGTRADGMGRSRHPDIDDEVIIIEGDRLIARVLD